MSESTVTTSYPEGFDPNMRPREELITYIEGLQASLDILRRSHRQVEETRDGHYQEILGWQRFWAVVNQRMIDESVRRNWCQEFDQILDQLAQEAPHFVNIQKREHQYCVSGTIQVTLVVPFSVGALAATEDDASDQVIDDPDCILDNLDLGGCARYVESTSVEVDNVIQD